MRNLQALATEGIGRYGQGRYGDLQIPTALDVLTAAKNMPEARTSAARGAGRTQEMAGEVMDLSRRKADAVEVE